MAYSRIFKEFADSVKKHSVSPAISFSRGKENLKITYEELLSKALKLGDLLYAKGIRRQDKVALLLGSQPEWPVSFFAVQYAGAVAVPIDIKLAPTEILQLVEHSRSKIILCSEKVYSRIKEEVKDLKNTEVFLVDSADFLKNIKAESANLLDKEPFPEDEPAAIFYTSGTTDLPKGVMLSQKNILSNVYSFRKVNLTRQNDVFISLLPLHHTYSFMVTCLYPLLEGLQICYPLSLNSEDLLSCMKRNRVSMFVAVPQVYLLLDRVIKEKLHKIPSGARLIIDVAAETLWWLRKVFKINLSRLLFFKIHRNFGGKLRLMITGGAKLEPQVILDFFKWGFTVMEGYGLTETSPVVAFNLPQHYSIGSVGRPIPGVSIRIENPDVRGMGEVAIKGANVMLGYFNNPDETAKVIKGEWFHSQDLGYLDKKGYLHILGRQDEVITLASGKKINPEDIERLYSESPYVKEVCVFAAEAEGFLHEVKKLMAVVVPDEERFKRSGVVNIEEKIRWELGNISQRISEYKRIKGFVISTQPLPRTQLGKLMRHRISPELLSGIASAPSVEKISSGDDSLLISSEICRKGMQYLSDRFKRKVNLEDHLELDLGLDSLGRVELLLELQEVLNIQVPEDTMTELFYATTVRELLEKSKSFLPQEKKEEEKKEEDVWKGMLSQDPGEDVLKLIRLQPTKMDRFMLVFLGTFFRILFSTVFLLKVRGKENLPEKGPFIIFANHTSYFDGFIVSLSITPGLLINAFFVGFREFFLHPLSRWSVKTARLIPIDITYNLTKALQACSYLLKHGKILCYFPEGQRSPTGEIIVFKKGFGILAKELDMPMIPMYIDGSYRAWPAFRMLPRPAKITVTIGKLFKPSDLVPAAEMKDISFEELAGILRQQLVALKAAQP